MEAKNSSIFESMAQEYDSWFDRHTELFQSEVKAIKKLVPDGGMGIEIGIGTGRFARQLNILVGVEPARAMAQMAITRGLTVINARAEDLPFHGQSFDYAVMITTDCFLDDIPEAFAEAHRVIKKNGFFIVAMIDKDGEIGKKYEEEKVSNPCYKNAHFHSVQEITDQLQLAGFTSFEYWQTLFGGKEEITDPLPGFGKGGFVVIGAQKI